MAVPVTQVTVAAIGSTGVIPAVNYGADQGQLETSVIIVTGCVGDSAEIEMVSL